MKYLLFALLLIFSGCIKTGVTAIPSPEVSRTAYAIRDSFDVARIDLAEQYSSDLLRLVIPPDEKIIIKPVVQNGKRIAIIPDKYKNDNVIVVGTVEWNNLSLIKDIADQLKSDNNKLLEQITKTDNEIRSQEILRIQIVDENNELKLKLAEKSNILLRTRLYLISIIGLIGGYIFLKIKKISLF